MQDTQPRLALAATVLTVAVALVAAAAGQPAWALSPDDATIRRAVENGKNYLLSEKPGLPGAASVELGQQCLVAIALLKCGVPADNPLVRQAVDSLKNQVKSGVITSEYHAVYNLGVGLVLLSTLKDKETAQAALKQLLSFQRSSGGFATTIVNSTGDTSMTQYAVLGMWEAAQLGVYAPPQAWQGVSGWLIQTQTAEGTFVYNPASPSIGLPPHSMTAAGLSSLYICANYVRLRNGVSKPREAGKGEKGDGGEVPSALVPVGGQKKEKAPPAAIAVDMPKLQSALSRSDGWLAKNFTVQARSWNLYYLYALERYFAFRDKLAGEPSKEPDWYSQGATLLLKTQGQNGSWNADPNSHAATAFALLFLVQSTKISLQAVAKAEEKAGGTLLSGSGLPADLSNIRVKGGKIVVKPLSGPAGEMLEIIQKPGDPRFEAAVEGLGELVLKADDIMLSPHLVMLKKLAKSGSPEARAAGVALLGRMRNLDVVPTLIFALQDEDEQVMRSAWEALRFTSRRYDTFGLSLNFTGDDKARAQAKAKAIEKWKAWYRSVRPDVDFDE